MLLGILWLITALLLSVMLYRSVFALAYLFGGEDAALPAPPTMRRFHVVVPAHDEELLIADVIASIRACRYPQELISITVIADNCSDNTANRVRALGETVVERHDSLNRGKGQALSWFFDRSNLEDADAVALFDADNLLLEDFFEIANQELEAGWSCLQAYYDIANPDDSIMTRMLVVTYVMKNLLFNAGKARFGCSVLLMGTGMVFSRETIERSGWQAMTIGEDYEQTFNLIEAGDRIRFMSRARIRAQESSTLRQGYAQRQRWMSGRRVLLGRAWRALTAGMRERSWHKVDVGLDLLMPTYSTALSATGITFLAALALLPASEAAIAVLVGLLAYQALEGIVALRIMRATPRFLASLAFAPVFLVFRGVIDLLAFFGHRSDKWARTERVSHTNDRTPDTSS